MKSLCTVQKNMNIGAVLSELFSHVMGSSFLRCTVLTRLIFVHSTCHQPHHRLYLVTAKPHTCTQIVTCVN